VLRPRIAIQLESLRQPLRSALALASQLGVEAVEINARTELRPGELSQTGLRHFRKLLADQNLHVCSLQFPTRRGYGDLADLDRRIESTKAALDFAFALGCHLVVNQLGPIPSSNDDPTWSTMTEVLAELGRHGQRAGAWLAARTGIDDGSRLAELIKALPDGSLGVDFDPGSLVIHDHAPEPAMRRLAKHVVSFRALDGVRDASGRTLYTQLGRGSVDFPILLSLLEEQRYNGYLIIERRLDSNPIDGCRQTIAYLKSLF
jgi:sugar phosphate isomerase/epimerase